MELKCKSTCFDSLHIYVCLRNIDVDIIYYYNKKVISTDISRKPISLSMLHTIVYFIMILIRSQTQ